MEQIEQYVDTCGCVWSNGIRISVCQMHIHKYGVKLGGSTQFRFKHPKNIEI